MAVTIESGVYSLSAPVGGHTVQNIRAMFAQSLNINPQAKAYSGASMLDETALVPDGGKVEFIKMSGRKGV